MSMSRLKLLFSFLLILFHSQTAKAYFIDYLKVQHAGEIGTYAVGIGKKFSKNYSLDFLHGRVPQSIGGVELDTYSLKNNFHLKTFYFDPIGAVTYAGINVYHVIGLDYQTSRHGSYPDNYYRLGSFRALFFLGEKIQFGRELKNEIFLEGGINDIVLTNYLNNRDTINPFDFVSLATGYTYIF